MPLALPPLKLLLLLLLLQAEQQALDRQGLLEATRLHHYAAHLAVAAREQ